MKIAVLGAGAIGGVVAAYLKQKQKDVCLIGRANQVEAIKRDGLNISGLKGDIKIDLEAETRLNSKVDLIILATKTQDIEEAYNQNKDYFKDTTVLTTQNGVRADGILAGLIGEDNIVSSIVMFGATYLKPGAVVYNFPGEWIIGTSTALCFDRLSIRPEQAKRVEGLSADGERPSTTLGTSPEFIEGRSRTIGRSSGANDGIVKEIAGEMSSAFEVVVSDNIVSQKWTKLFVNLNNCIPALCGLTMQEVFSDIEMCKLALALQKEAYMVIDKAGIKPGELPGFDIDKARGLAFMPLDKGAAIFSGIMTGLSGELLYGSILQSIKRGRPSEIDYINGEIVALAKKTGISAPINEKIVELVHRVEKTGRFFTKEEAKEIIWKAG